MVKKVDINNENFWRFLSNPEKYKEYWDKQPRAKYDLKIETTRRQFNTASKILKQLKAQKGVLLADDVGLGKTTIAALVACVYAGKGKTVIILAPNKTMQTRWKKEIDNHVEILNSVAINLKIKKENIHTRALERLKPYNIIISTHTKSLPDSFTLKCDLLVIDEAHRAKGDGSKFANKIIEGKNKFEKVLILTATPFSIQIDELKRMLKIVGMPDIEDVSAFDKKLDELWNNDYLVDEEGFSKELLRDAEDAVNSLRKYVIRHSVDDLNEEKKHFGKVETIGIDVENAEPNDYEILIRVDRLFQQCKKYGYWNKTRTNDARYHVGWNKLKEDIKEIEDKMKDSNNKEHEIIRELTIKIKKLLNEGGNHPKAVNVANEVKKIVEKEEEKILIFCDHHATAAELTCLIASTLIRKRRKTNSQLWKKSWKKIIPLNEMKDDEILRENFINWLCSPNIQSQIADWIGEIPNDSEELIKILKKTPARKLSIKNISDSAVDLYYELIDEDSKSTLSVLKNLAEGSLKFETAKQSRMPGMPHDRKLKMPVISTASINDMIDDKFKYLFFSENIDIVMAIFNSPFGPDVLVTTDRLSEGIDLHGCCRHLIHYELDPSPIRIIQRNGRIRRVNSWAAKTEKPIEIVYPVFKGTRDEKLVKIMRDRLDRFDLLLGGVGGKIEIDGNNETEQKRLDVIKKAKKGLKELSLALKN
jgi:ERCC4-related helicase